MGVYVNTENPNGILASIKSQIKNGTISTWKIYVHEGHEFITHTDASGQWENKAFFLPSVDLENGQLNFGMYGHGNTPLERIYYSVYHGKLTQMILSHFEENITGIYSSSKKAGIDNFILEKY